MKLGDMTVKQLAEMCFLHTCQECPFEKDGSKGCPMLVYPFRFDLNMEVKTDAEDQS